jgi:hypothetical protein
MVGETGISPFELNIVAISRIAKIHTRGSST